MSKTNFTKVEDSFNEGLGKIKMQQLHQKAQEATSSESALVLERRQQLHYVWIWMRHEIKRGLKKDKLLYQHAQLDAALENLLQQNEESLTDEQWLLLLQNHEKLSGYLTQHKQAKDSNESLLKEQQELDEKRRFNVSKRWIPLK